MAKRQFMSKRPSSRVRLKQSNRNATRRRGKSQQTHARSVTKNQLAETAVESLFQPLGENIENGRQTLLHAQTVLACLYTTMEYADEDDDDPPYYPYLVELARKLIREAVGRLDSIHRRPIIEKLKKAVRERIAN
jgi:hypothetical protein